MNRIDELNIAGRSMPYEKYFGEMDLSDRQKKERMEISEEFEDMMAFLFALLAVMDEYAYDDEKTKTAAKQVENRYLEILGTHMKPDDSLREYAREFARDIVETTIGHIDDPWYLSDDRAVFVAENEANTAYNYADYRQAVDSGKTHKQWITMKDQRVRKTHREVDGETIPIDEVFLVGESLMRYPKDTSLGASAEEIVNCRCTVRYVGKGRKANNTLAKPKENVTIESGAVSGARNPYGKAADEHAKRYYGLVRSMTTDVEKIAKSSGFSVDEIQEIKNYVFMEKHDLGGDVPEYFAPDFMMAESWRRLQEGKPEPHDITLLNHEKMERELMKNGLSQTEAHSITSRKYNYDKEAAEFYGKIKKFRKE